ncbi:MAG: hypothetical protein CR986_07355 [Ignavibacteriae bacterium]|nr:MAG: hypothetical protein CR986_07355 [Ignavibacteriota bacterium]
MKKLFFISFILFITSSQFAQVQDYELGADYQNGRRNVYGGYFDYSDQEAINIEVSVWGYAKYPGRYFIPDYTSVLDLISFVGGPTDDSNLDELRIYRVDENKREIMIPINYNDLMWEDNLQSKYRKVPKLQAGDILVIPGEPRLYSIDWLSIGVSLFLALVQLATLILTINDLK